MRIGRTCIVAATVFCGCGLASGTIVNIDFEAGLAGDQTYVGDDGTLSTAGGTTWTSVLYPGATDLPDEFGNTTPFGVELMDSFTTSNAAAGNSLQDSGTGAMMNIVGLVPGELYNIAGYVDVNGGFSVTDATGFINFFGFGDPAADGWSLPGTQGVDYFLVGNLQPFEIEPGKWGIVIGLDGTMTGLQISGVVPEPATLSTLLSLALLVVRRRRSVESRVLEVRRCCNSGESRYSSA